MSIATRALIAPWIGAALLLSGCGGGGSGGESSGGGTASGGTGSGTTPSSRCSLAARKTWLRQQVDEWYLFPETVPASLDPAPYATLQDYLDALTEGARAQGRDRGFSYVTTVAADEQFFGDATSVGFGLSLAFTNDDRLLVRDVIVGSPAANAAIARGTEIVRIGLPGQAPRTPLDIFRQDGEDGLIDALAPSAAGAQRVFVVRDQANITRETTLRTAEIDMEPVPSDYGTRIINHVGGPIGYVHLRAFVEPADAPLRATFAQFKAAGVSRLIVDLRYNGGGLLSTAKLLGNLMAANRFPSDVFATQTFRPEKASFNVTDRFASTAESIGPGRIAFITTQETASASELVINAMLPYYGADVAMIGSDSFGKPVGQSAYDLSECGDRLRLISFSTANAQGNADYYNGLAASMRATCQATDDLAHALGDEQEAMIQQAISYLDGNACTPIVGVASPAAAGQQAHRPLRPLRRTGVDPAAAGLF